MDWIRWTQRLQAIAQTGLTYSTGAYDLGRYEELRALAVELAAGQLQRPTAEVATLIAGDVGYPTPKVDVRAVVFDREGRLLFVREREEKLWSLPGGWADQGSSPGEMAARETLEESGFRVRPVKLLSVHDRRTSHGYPPSLQAVYKLFIRCELEGGERQISHETDAAEFFARDQLPELSLHRVSPSQIERMFVHRDTPDLPTDFD